MVKSLTYVLAVEAALINLQLYLNDNKLLIEQFVKEQNLVLASQVPLAQQKGLELSHITRDTPLGKGELCNFWVSAENMIEDQLHQEVLWLNATSEEPILFYQLNNISYSKELPTLRYAKDFTVHNSDKVAVIACYYLRKGYSIKEVKAGLLCVSPQNQQVYLSNLDSCNCREYITAKQPCRHLILGKYYLDHINVLT